jgi:hypothetical protein
MAECVSEYVEVMGGEVMFEVMVSSGLVELMVV